MNGRVAAAADTLESRVCKRALDVEADVLL